MKKVDHSGKSFGKLIILSKTGRTDSSKNMLYRVGCICGNVFESRADVIICGKRTSCGCTSWEHQRAQVKRNEGRRAARRSWYTMLAKCAGKMPGVHHYLRHGITVCDRWREFDAFYADMGDRPSGTTLDRINTKGNYEPGNCRWATKQQQIENRRTNKILYPE